MLHPFFEAPLPDTALLVAEGADGERLGFAYLETLIDYFDRKPHAHLAELAVARAGGRVAARAARSSPRRRTGPAPPATPS